MKRGAALPWVAAALALHLYILAQYWSNVPLQDDYTSILGSVLDMQQAKEASQWWQALLSQANEHRAATTRLVPLALAWVTGSIDFRLLALAGTVFLVAAFALMVREHRGELPAPVVGAGAFLLFQWSYNEALLQASGAIPHLGVVFFAFAALHFAVRPGGASLAACVAGAVLATFSQASGLFVAPIAAAGCLLLGQYRRAALLAALAAALWLFYFTGYSKPSHHPTLLYVLAHPIAALRLFLVTIGGVTTSLALSQLTGAALLAAMAWLAWKGHARRHPTVFLWMAFILASAAAVTIGRAGFGIFYASRYAIHASLLLTLVLFGLASVTGPWARDRSLGVFIGAVAISLAVSIASHSQLLYRAFNASLLMEVDASAVTDELPRFLGTNYHDKAKVHRILESAGALGLYAPPRRSGPLPAPALLKATDRPAADRRGGFVDSVAVEGRFVRIEGWADRPATVPRREFEVFPSNGIASMRYERTVPREDVVQMYQSADLMLSGFRLVLEYGSEQEAILGARTLCLFAREAGQPAAVLYRHDARCE